MRNTLTLMGMLVLVVACDSSDGEDDAAGSDEAATIADDGTGGTTGDDATGSATGATSATTATTATTDPSGDPETTGDPEDTGEAESTGAAELSCSEYCDVYLAGCVDFNAYANEADCLAHCGQWPVGDPSDTAHDSVGCRLYHATVASGTDPELHCPHAGPNGDATCVSADAPTCDLYCTRYFGNCTDDLNAFADMADCMEQCGEWYPGSEADVDGHTVGCRSYHANAALGDPELHCPHAGPGGGGICVL